MEEKIEDVVHRMFTKGSHKALIAGDVLTKYRETGNELSKDYREDLIEKYMQSKDTPAKSRKRIADVLSTLRKAGHYIDAYARGEKPAVGVKKKPSEKDASTVPAIKSSPDPSILPSISPSASPSIPLREGSVEDDGQQKTPSPAVTPEALTKEGSPPPKKPAVEQMAEALGIDPRELQVFLDAKRKEKAKSEEDRIHELVDQRLQQLLTPGASTSNPKNPPPPHMSDAEKMKTTMEGMSPAELRLLLKRKSGGVENPLLAVFQYMESETSIVDIMDELGLDFEQIIEYQEKFNRMKALELERQQMNEPYLKAWFDIAQVLGENVRRDCDKYNEVNGVCLYWHLDDLSKTYRDQFKGMYRSGKSKGGGYYIDVNKHPEVCAVCPVKNERSEIV